jgi:hypothetical protein
MMLLTSVAMMRSLTNVPQGTHHSQSQQCLPKVNIIQKGHFCLLDKSGLFVEKERLKVVQKWVRKTKSTPMSHLKAVFLLFNLKNCILYDIIK